MKILYLIPARGGSKGVPKKNIKDLAGVPLIGHTIKAALEVADADDICVSTDSNEIAEVAKSFGLSIPFLRPAEIASDHATNEQVILHALNFYRNKGVIYDYVVVLQPTSPLRKGFHIKEALNLIDKNSELIVSVKETDSNPYYVLFEENQEGVLDKVKKGVFTRRQDCPVVYELNGAIYVIHVEKLEEKGYQNLKMTKYLMGKLYSIDIDDLVDFSLAEILLSKKIDSQKL
ncbi:N-acylneuraminate cytidylyltransferase [Algoriphagus iocasae]|uniref:N-acylneuraminate cytidylyltransferase n=1 Tax=Algoriphagus iocasae TaxID=1836499 RepID=A0A841MYM9_9BACT|nr:acylneuraminate cytidylyltransferase family protein [Algoriphagus iocasae]MBB6327738.1 N-acylneuraminate cytidylyltransferase [Algoriphagus iocasae]